MKKLTISLLLCTSILLTGCQVSAETANHAANSLDNIGLSPVANSLREYINENVEYVTQTQESEIYSLDLSEYAQGTVILSKDDITKIYSPTVGEIEFNYDQIYRINNTFYAITGEKRYEEEVKDQIVAVEIDKTDKSPVSIANGSYESISEEYTRISFTENDDYSNLLIVCPSEHYEHYWYMYFKDIDGVTYYTSVVTMGYDQEESREIFDNMIATREYP